MIPKVFSKKEYIKDYLKRTLCHFSVGGGTKNAAVAFPASSFLPPLLTRDEFNKGDYVGGDARGQKLKAFFLFLET